MFVAKSQGNPYFSGVNAVPFHFNLCNSNCSRIRHLNRSKRVYEPLDFYYA